MTPNLTDLRACVDVQHLYRTDRPRDRGSIYALPGGRHVAEADLASVYAASLAHSLEDWGATVLVNEPTHGILTGTYAERNRAAGAWGAHVYLACHVNAGGGSYARVESLASSGLETGILATRVLKPLGDQVHEIVSTQAHALALGERGRICIEGGPPEMAAVILEPFFGDCWRHWPLFAAPRLVQVGAALALGVADWWVWRRGVRPA